MLALVFSKSKANSITKLESRGSNPYSHTEKAFGIYRNFSKKPGMKMPKKSDAIGLSADGIYTVWIICLTFTLKMPPPSAYLLSAVPSFHFLPEPIAPGIYALAGLYGNGENLQIEISPESKLSDFARIKVKVRYLSMFSIPQFL